MRMIDVQDHAYERNHPGRPWVGQLHGPQSANGEEMIAAMDAVGVDAAIIVSTFNPYRPISIATTRVTRWRCMRNGPTAFGS
jgi:L-fuconolactonase